MNVLCVSPVVDFGELFDVNRDRTMAEFDKNISSWDTSPTIGTIKTMPLPWVFAALFEEKETMERCVNGGATHHREWLPLPGKDSPCATYLSAPPTARQTATEEFFWEKPIHETRDKTLWAVCLCSKTVIAISMNPF